MDKVINLSSTDFLNKISTDSLAVIIDVRTPEEFYAGHIPNSILIDIYHPNFQNRIKELDKSKNYYIYCRSGHRSYHAGNFMLQMGFEKVHHLQEGILSWNEVLEK
ncbi:MAG TPA: rhodanese-like domain-containing protein [Ignavibacteriaceae bacterium]|nr:rhodanese-like domain-containing protein [Ignavibacteriaceae bacterium]